MIADKPSASNTSFYAMAMGYREMVSTELPDSLAGQTPLYAPGHRADIGVTPTEPGVQSHHTGLRSLWILGKPE